MEARTEPDAPIILVVEDDASTLRLIGKFLETAGYRVIGSADGEDALRRASSHRVDLIVTDWMMPVMDGLELTRRIRAHPELANTYIILLTAKSQTTEKVLALDAGADDYVTKPFSREEFLARIRAGLRIRRVEQELAEKNRMLETLAVTDSLTGLSNRRAINRRLEEEWLRFRRYARHFSVIILDIDLFKPVNDTYGHEMGDRVLREVACTLYRCVRDVDTVGRLGGDEFLIVLPETSQKDAWQVSERLREAVGKLEIEAGGRTVSITLSAGVASTETLSDPQGQSSECAIFAMADKALYSAKAQGRNQVAAVEASAEDRELRPEPSRP